MHFENEQPKIAFFPRLCAKKKYIYIFHFEGQAVKITDFSSRVELRFFEIESPPIFLTDDLDREKMVKAN